MDLPGQLQPARLNKAPEALLFRRHTGMQKQNAPTASVALQWSWELWESLSHAYGWSHQRGRLLTALKRRSRLHEWVTMLKRQKRRHEDGRGWEERRREGMRVEERKEERWKRGEEKERRNTESFRTEQSPLCCDSDKLISSWGGNRLKKIRVSD